MKRKPSVFIGSSSEGLAIAEALQVVLETTAEVELWTQGIFDLSVSYLEALIKEINKVDFAVLVLTSDDLVESRGSQSKAPRDNVLFEFGLFMGRLGRQRCFFVYDSNQNLKIPSDLLGISAATYRLHASGNIQASIGVAATRIKNSINSLGCQPSLLFSTHDDYGNDFLPDISGAWAGYSPDKPNPEEQNSILEIEQRGSFIRAFAERRVQEGIRRFDYEGRFSSGQLVLFFEEAVGRGFIIGSMVLNLTHDLRTLVGKSTYFHHGAHKVISTDRLYKRLISPS